LIVSSATPAGSAQHYSLAEITDSNVDAWMSKALKKTSTVPTPATLKDVTEAQLKDRCHRYYSADRYILRGFLEVDGSKADESRMAQEHTGTGFAATSLRCRRSEDFES